MDPKEWLVTQLYEAGVLAEKYQQATAQLLQARAFLIDQAIRGGVAPTTVTEVLGISRTRMNAIRENPVPDITTQDVMHLLESYNDDPKTALTDNTDLRGYKGKMLYPPYQKSQSPKARATV